jgi:hypothetical protein
MLITANLPFGVWGKVFPDPAMTLAAVDRLVHHATIFEINVACYRRRPALERKQKGMGRPRIPKKQSLQGLEQDEPGKLPSTAGRHDRGAALIRG